MHHNLKNRFWGFACLIGAVSPVLASTEPVIGFQATHATTITLAHHVDYITAPPPVRVLPQSTLRIELGEVFADAVDIVWYQDGNTRPESDRFITVKVGDTDTKTNFQASVVMDGQRLFTHGVAVVVTEPEVTPLQNLSTKIQITSESPEIVVGFVVGAEGGFAYPGRQFLVRGIGPGLSQFGVVNPLSDPFIVLRESLSDADITPGLVFPEVIYPDGSTPASRYQAEVDQVAQQVGAFPAPTKAQGTAGPRDIGFTTELPPGAYTLTVSSMSGSTGEVLVEVYTVGR